MVNPSLNTLNDAIKAKQLEKLNTLKAALKEFRKTLVPAAVVDPAVSTDMDAFVSGQVANTNGGKLHDRVVNTLAVWEREVRDELAIIDPPPMPEIVVPTPPED